MDSVQSWLDPDDVRRLAQRLIVGRRTTELRDAETPFGSNFEGFAVETPQQVAASPPVAVEPPELPAEPPAGAVAGREGRPANVAAAPTPEPTMPESPPPPPRVIAAAPELESVADLTGPAVEPRPTETPRGPFLQRVQRFREWLRDQFAARGMFLLDREGTLIFDDGVHEKLHALARNLAHASRVAPGPGSNVHVKISADATLEVIPVDTRYGLLVLGAVVPQAVPARGVALITDGLRRTATPPQ